MDESQKTESEQLKFFDECCARYNQAANAVGKIKYFYHIGGFTICLSFAGNGLIDALTPALGHLRIQDPDSVDLTLLIWDSQSTGIPMVQAPCERESFTDRGDIWGFHSKRIKTAFHWIEFSVNVMDLDSGKGVYWVQNAQSLPFWVYASPLRTLLHWWMEKNNRQLLHAAAVGTKHGAVLITGKGGSGKSTTSLVCLKSGFYYLADDYLIVQLEPEPKVHSLYCSAKLEPEQLVNLREFERFVDNPEKLDQEKAVMFLYPHLKKQIVPSMELKALFMPEIINQKETAIQPIDYWKIQRAMSFTTMSQLPGVGYHTHEFINKASKLIPSFSLELGSQINEIPHTIADFLSKSVYDKKNNTVKKKKKENVNNLPLISVIVPVFNGEKFIHDAVKNIIDQNYPALEIIIVDDGSKDNTRAVVEILNKDIRYFYQDNQGPASARNRGIKDASGEFIAFLDVDDLWPENNLNVLVAYLLENPEVMVVRGYAQLMEISEQTGEYNFIGNPRESFSDYIGAALYRESVFRKAGLFDQYLTCGEDTEWFKKTLSLNILVKRIKEVTLHVRRHGGNMTLNESFVQKNKLHIFKKALDQVRTLDPELNILK